MKLKKTVRYLFTIKSRPVFLLFGLIFLFHSNLTLAQKYTIDVSKDETVASALQKASDKYKIKLAFDAGKLSQAPIRYEVMGNTTDELISSIISSADLEFKYKNGRYLILPQKSDSATSSEIECQMQGTVTDSETGESLPYATISLTNQNISTTSSEGGTFSIKNITVNPIHLKISFIGFQAIDTLLNRTNSILNCNFKLSRKTQVMDSVVVKGIKMEMVDFRNDVDFATTINPMKINDLPIVVETDIFKTLQLLPGISYTSNSSELSIRGGSSDQNLILFDGQTLYNLSHYYGVVSSINPNVIKDIQVYKGGYDSRYGERISGIVDIHGKTGNMQKPTVYGDVNLVCGNITTEVPIGKKFSVVAAYRRSYSDIYNTSLSNSILSDNKPNTFNRDNNELIYQTTPSFHFYDYNTKLTYRISDNEQVSLSVIGSKDFFDNSYAGNTDTFAINTTDKNNWSSYGYSASWFKQWNESVFTNIQAGTSGFSNEYSNNDSVKWLIQSPGFPQRRPDYNVKTNVENDLKDLSLSLRNVYYINNNNHLNFGLLTRRNSIYYHKDADKTYVYDNMDESSWVTSAYMQDKLLLGSKLTLKPGMRANYYNTTNKFYFEPRFAANYRVSDKFSVRMATGRYYQFISQVLSQQESGYNRNFWVLANDSTHPVLKSNHFVIGSSVEFGRFMFDGEIYYKGFSGIQEYISISPFLRDSVEFRPHNQNGPANGFMNSTSYSKSLNAGGPQQPIEWKQPSYFISGIGEAYGMDLFVRYKSRMYTGWVSYSLSKTIHWFSDINNNSAIPAPADQTHQLSFTNMVTLGNWNLGSTTLFSTGRPYFKVDETNRQLPFTRNYVRLPNYFRSDVSVNYNIKYGILKLKIGATVVNIFNTKNYFDVNTRKFDFENTSIAETNQIRSQDLSLNFFLHFSL